MLKIKCEEKCEKYVDTCLRNQMRRAIHYLEYKPNASSLSPIVPCASLVRGLLSCIVSRYTEAIHAP